MAEESVNVEEDYGSYWEAHLQVYRQPLVWLASALSNREGNTSTIYLLAILASANALIMLIASLSLPALLLTGVIMLLISLCLAFCILTNLPNRFKMYPNWGNREEGLYKLVCSKVGAVHCNTKQLFSFVFKMRDEDPKKFYGAGIALSFLFSYIGKILSTSSVLHITVTLLLLTPLMFHYQLHTHFMNQNWDQLLQSLNLIVHSVVDAIKNTWRQVTGSGRGANRGGRGRGPPPSPGAASRPSPQRPTKKQ